MAGNQVRIPVSAPGANKASSEIDQLRDRLAKVKSAGAKGFAIGAGVAATNLAFGALRGTVGAVTDKIDEATTAFMDDERSQVQLKTAIRGNVEAWDGNTAAIERTLEARMKLGFSDDEQRDSLKGLVAAYQDVDAALEVQRTAMDLARFSGIDLASASEALTKVHAGQFRVLKSLGISTKGITTEQQALAAIQRVTAGQAEDYANTLEGRVVVAEVKAAEATESLGKNTAELSASMKELEAGFWEDVAGGINDVGDALSLAEQPMERQNDLMKHAIDLLPFMSQEQKDAAKSALDMRHDYIEVGDALDRGVTPAVEDLTDAVKDGIDPTHDLRREVALFGDAAHDATEKVDDLASTISDELFGDAINAGNLAELRDTHDELIKQRDAAKEGSREWKILTGKIAENEQAQFDLQYQMAQQEGPQAVLDFLKKARDRWGKNNEAVRTQIDLLAEYWRKIQMFKGISFAGGGLIFTGIPTTHRAAGGPLAAGQASVVGEKGPEVFVPNQAGTVIPNGAAMGGGGSSLTINVSTPVMTPGSAEALARYLEPIITRSLQKRGQLGAARAF